MKKQKLLIKILRNPKNVKFQEFVNLIKAF